MTPRARMTGCLRGEETPPLVALWDEPEVRQLLWQRLGRGRAGLLAVPRVCRIEHPHCAFYRTGEDPDLVRTALHTPDGSLTQDARVSDGEILRHYVSKTEKYGILLSFLRDVVVVPDSHGPGRAREALGDEGLVLAQAPSAPADEMATRWRDTKAFLQDLENGPEGLKPCLRQMRRIFEQQAACLAAGLGDELDGLWVGGGSVTGALAPEDFLHHSQPLYRALYEAGGRRLMLFPLGPEQDPAQWTSQPARIKGAVPVRVAGEADSLALAPAVQLPAALCLHPEALARALRALPGAGRTMWILPAALTPPQAVEAAQAALAALEDGVTLENSLPADGQEDTI